MKPVSLNQLLFHPKVDSLSFFLSQKEGPQSIESFLSDMQTQLNLQERPALARDLEKNKAPIKKILKSHVEKSVGFFLSEDLQGYVVLDQRIGPYCVIGQTFHVRPLLEELFVNPEFLLVNVSLYDIKIFKGDFRHLEIIQHYEFDQLPKNFTDLSSRIFAPKFMGAIPYKSILAMKTIAQKLHDMILYESRPVIVTGPQEMKTIFLNYLEESPGIISHIDVDFYEKTAMEILQECRSFRYVVTDYYSAQLKERLKRLLKSKLILSDLSEIIRAIYAGKVGHLVIPTERKIWGKFDPKTGEFIIHKKIGKTSIDILNELAEEVIRQGGRIQIMGPHFFPLNASALAIIKGQV